MKCRYTWWCLSEAWMDGLCRHHWLYVYRNFVKARDDLIKAPEEPQ
jgi:hypothetical protein